MEEDIANGAENSDKNMNAIPKKKHEAMIERLTNLHKSRLQQTISCKSDSESAPSFESTSSFLNRFSELKNAIHSHIKRHCSLASDPEEKVKIKADLEKVVNSIKDLEKLLSENSYFLPSYEVRSCLKVIDDLKVILEKTNSEVLPRKKFSFRNKSSNKEQRSGVNVHEILHCDNAVEQMSISSETGKNKVSIRETPGLKNMQGILLTKHLKSSDERDFTLSDLDSCEIHITGCLRALFIHRLRNCKIFIGPVLGSILIEEVEGCLFILASHQIRIHNARVTDFYLRVRSRPIIEDSNALRFAPYNLTYIGIEKDLKDSALGEETGSWANVDDFKWLRAKQSPNWCLLPEEERISTIDISDLNLKNGDP